MKNIREIQYTKVRELYQELLRNRNELISSDKVRNLFSEIIYSVDRTPLCGEYRLTAYDEIDVNALNTELGLIKVDYETVSEYLTAYYNRLRGLSFVTKVWKEMSKRKINNVLNEVIKLSSPMFIKGFTEELDTAAYTDRDNSSLSVLEDGSITLMSVTSTPKTYIHRPRDISIQKVGSDALTAKITGDPTTIVNQGEIGGVVLDLVGKVIEEAGFTIAIKTNLDDVNQISVNMGEESNGIKVQLELSADGSKFKTIFNQVIRRSKFDVPVKRTSIRILRMTVTMSNPNIVTLNESRYQFRLYKIMMLNTTRRNSGVWQSNRVDLESDIAQVSLAIEDEYNGDTEIRYYVSVNEDSESNAIGFVSFNPDKTGEIVNLESSTYKMTIAPKSSDPRWKIQPEKKWGAKLYNILDVPGITVESGDFSINNGKITFTDPDTSIVEDTIKLYRGYYDYVQKERQVELKKHVPDISTEVEFSEATEWVEAIYLRTKLRQLIDDVYIENSGDNYRNKITIPWKVTNLDDIYIERDDGQEVYAFVSSVLYRLPDNSEVTIREYLTSHTDKPVDATIVTYTGLSGEVILDDNFHYYATFTVSLAEYILRTGVQVELDLTTFNVSVAGQELVQGLDYRVHPNMFMLELLRTGSYANHVNLTVSNDNVQGATSPINVSYDFSEGSEQSTTYFETNIYVAVPTDVVILPYTAAEIASGNFHNINGSDVSTLTSYTLRQGWNTIQTTNPYPSVNEFDINALTGESSTAGIVIPENIESMRPYLDSMRQVSPFLLSTLDPAEGEKCFSFVDNEIYVNFLPDFVEADIISDAVTSGTKGQTMICKKPVLDIDYSNTGYLAFPETFEFEFSYTNDNTEKFVYIQVSMESKSGAYNGKVNRIGLNKYRELS